MLHTGHEHRPRTDTILRVLVEILIRLEENVSCGHKIHLFVVTQLYREICTLFLCRIDLDFLIRLIN